MTIQTTPFAPDTATDDDLAGYHAVLADAWAVDAPNDPPQPYAATVAGLRKPSPLEGPRTFWTARVDGRVVGTASVGLPDHENADVAWLRIVIHPDTRRGGVGVALARAVLPHLVASGRRTVIGVLGDETVAGTTWTARLGFEVTSRDALQSLDVAATSAELWDVPVPDGYHLRRWIGAVPDELLAAYAAARPAIHEAPMGTTTWRLADWTEARVREVERELAELGIEERVVVAVREGTGEVAGLTVLDLMPGRRDLAHQKDTVVLPEHRGRGLGRAIKGSMMRWLVVDRPELARVNTTTASDNAYMIAVNEQLGYSTLRTVLLVETSPERLAGALGAW